MSDSDHGQWLQIDEATDVAASLRHFAICLGLLEHDSAAWKWVIISIHNALQGAMTCHLSGTAKVGCLSKKSFEEWSDWHQRDRRGEIKWIELPADELGIPSRRPASKTDQHPRSHMATPQTLFDRLSKEESRFEGGCGLVLSVTSNQHKSFKILNELRNQFAHFTPMGWSIEVSGLRDIFRDIIDVISAISEDPWPFRCFENNDKSAMDLLIIEISQKLSTPSN